MTTTIRVAEPDDYDQVVGFLDEWWDGRQMQLMLPRLFFVEFRPWAYAAERNGAVAGFLSAFRSQTDPALAYCHFNWVAPSCRGQGTGKVLYQRLFTDALLAGCREVLAMTSPQNAASLAFHARLGFLPLPGSAHVGGVPYTPSYDGPGQDRMRFRKPLDVSAADHSRGD